MIHKQTLESEVISELESLGLCLTDEHVTKLVTDVEKLIDGADGLLTTKASVWINLKKMGFLRTEKEKEKHQSFTVDEIYDVSFDDITYQKYSSYVGLVIDVGEIKTFERKDKSSGTLQQLKVRSLDSERSIVVKLWDMNFPFSTYDICIFKGFIVKDNEWKDKVYKNLVSGKWAKISKVV